MKTRWLLIVGGGVSLAVCLVIALLSTGDRIREDQWYEMLWACDAGDLAPLEKLLQNGLAPEDPPDAERTVSPWRGCQWVMRGGRNTAFAARPTTVAALVTLTSADGGHPEWTLAWLWLIMLVAATGAILFICAVWAWPLLKSLPRVAKTFHQRRPHVLPGCLVTLLIAVFLGVSIETRREYCTLCGKDRRMVAICGLDISAAEEPTEFSVALEAVVHHDGSPHTWSSIRRHSLLDNLWWDMNPRFAPRWIYALWHDTGQLMGLSVDRGHLWIDWARGYMANELQATTFWDPELGVAIGQMALQGRLSDEEMHHVSMFLPFQKGIPPALKHVNSGREFCGLPLLDERELEEMVRTARTRSGEGGSGG